MELSLIDCDSDDAVLIDWKDNGNGISKSNSDSCLNRERESLLHKRPYVSFETSDTEGKVNKEDEMIRLFKRPRIECEMKIDQYDESPETLDGSVKLDDAGRCYRWLYYLSNWYQEDVPRFLFWVGATYAVVRMGEYL